MFRPVGHQILQQYFQNLAYIFQNYDTYAQNDTNLTVLNNLLTQEMYSLNISTYPLNRPDLPSGALNNCLGGVIEPCPVSFRINTAPGTTAGFQSRSRTTCFGQRGSWPRRIIRVLPG